MMNLNNKGITLVELLVSIVLVSVVLVFIVQLITDLKNETQGNDFAYNNQLNRTEVLYTLQNDLNNNYLVGVEDKSADDIELHFYYKGPKGDQDTVLKSYYTTKKNVIGEDEKIYYISYKDINGLLSTWEMKGAALNPCGTFTYYIDTLSNNYYFKLNFEIYNYVYHPRNNQNRNNLVDDIEISFASEKNALNTSVSNYLTNNSKGKKQVGVCDAQGMNDYIEHILKVTS